MGEKIKLGFDIHTQAPVCADLRKTGHLCITGGTGSGKTTATLFALNSVLNLPVEIDLSIGDFKKSGDYKGLSRHFAEFDKTTELIDSFYEEFNNTPENSPGIKILLLDEYAGYIVWLMQQDKKKCEEIKGKISSLLMLGRSRHCFVWCIQQRMTAQLFPSGIGAIDNFQICMGLGRLSPDSRKSLFAGERLSEEGLEDNFQPGQGQGLCLIDGQPLRAIQIPYVSDTGKLKSLLARKASMRGCV